MFLRVWLCFDTPRSAEVPQLAPAARRLTRSAPSPRCSPEAARTVPPGGRRFRNDRGKAHGLEKGGKKSQARCKPERRRPRGQGMLPGTAASWGRS